MKNYLMFALMMGAIASVAFGQVGVADPVTATIDCPADECHVAPYFKGEGGFIGEIADGFDEVAFVVDCGIVNTSGTAEPNSDGIVAELLVMDNGLACADGGSVEIHGLMDGGWYWINDTDNSAVASLIAKDALGNAATAPANPGGTDITLDTPEDGMTSIIKQASTGRIGILHHILPEPTAAAADLCGPYWDGDDRTFYNDTSSCMLGSGAAKIVMTGPGRNGRETRLSGSVERNVSTASASAVTVSFGLWSAASAAPGTAATGHLIGTRGSSTLVGHDITLPATLRSAFSVEPFAADFTIDVLSPAATTLGEAGIVELDGDVLSEMTPMSVVPGTPDGDSSLTSADTPGQQDNNLGVVSSTDATPIPEITNGWGMFDGEVTYCRQATSRNEDGNLVLHFATSAGGVVMLEPDPDGDGSLSSLAATANWADQLTWAQAWNGANTDSSKYISILTMDLNDTPTPDDATDDTSFPEVVCAVTEGETVDVKGTGGIEIAATSQVCNDRTRETVRLRITAPLSQAQAANDSTPPIAWAGRVDGVHIAAQTTLDVLCPAASASTTSRDLVPDNPFPVD